MRQFDEPAFPLTSAEFRHALNAGLGRARIHLDQHGLSTELRDIVLASSLSCQFYDPQVDGLPGDWFADFCITADIVPQILAARPGLRHWDQAWRFSLLAAFTRRNYPDAKLELYNALIETDDGDLLGAEDLIEVEGDNGLLYVAQRLGAMWRNNAPADPDEGPLSEYDATRFEGAAREFLGAAAKADLNVATYLHVLNARPPRAAPRPRTRLTPSELFEHIVSGEKPRLGFTYSARKFSAIDMAPIRALATSTSDEVVLENCLRALAGCEDAIFDPALFSFLNHASDAVRHYTARAISQVCAQEVATLGREYLTTDLALGLTLLRRSAESSDLESIVDSVARYGASANPHDVPSALMDLIEDSNVPPDPRLLLFAYETTPCQTCRHQAVETLLEANICPEWLLTEARLDANEYIRKLVDNQPMTT